MKRALLVLTLVCSCGPSQTVAPVAPPPSTDSAFNQIAPVIQRACSKCHNGSFQPAFSASNFKSSSAAQRLTNGSMPPTGNPISSDDKTALLVYLAK